MPNPSSRSSVDPGSGQNVATLLGNAQNDGAISPHTAQAINIVDLGAQIQMGIGVDVSDVKSSEVTLVSLMPDDSGSIRFVPGNTEAVREGHNQVIDALRGSKQSDGILAYCRYLNGRVLYPFSPLDRAVQMETTNYNPDGGTPLYDQAVVLLSTVLAKTQSFEDNGVPCRSVTLIITDGADQGSRHQSPANVRALVQDMLKTESHIIAAMGIDDGTTDFWYVFTGWTKAEIDKAKGNGKFESMLPKGGMGIIPKWVLVPGNSPTELRRAFNTFSQSAVRSSQGGASFSQAAAGGFGA